MNDYEYDSREQPYGGWGSRGKRGMRDRLDARWVDPTRTHTKSSHPYSYSEFFHFGDRDVIKAKDVHGDYSDRLHQWASAKFEQLWKKHLDCRWEQASRPALNAFMSAYFDKKVKVVALAEGCNPSNGYPYYIVWTKETP